MKRAVPALLISLTASLFAQAQTVETIPFRAALSSANESTSPPNPVTGAATVWLHLVRDSAGKVVSGSVDATVSYNFSAENTLTAMHIHKGAAGVDGPVVVPFSLARTTASAKGLLPAVQTNFPSDAVSLDIINGILADPSGYYFNVHSTDAPGGVMRGQLQRAEMIVRMGIMQPENETLPVAGQPFSGVGTAVMLVTRDASGSVTSAYVIFDLAYKGFAPGTNFSGFHIHTGGAQTSGPVVIDSGLKGPVDAGATGSGVLHFETEVDLTRSGALDAINLFSTNPIATYINAHTTAFPGGAIRSQLQKTDRMDFQVSMTPAQEVPPITGLNAEALSRVSVYTLRNGDGTIAAGAVIFDENPRFPTGTRLTATHIHDGLAGQTGPVIIDSRLSSSPLLVNDGTGNIYRVVTVADPKGLATLASLTTTPWKQYLNLHSSANPGGGVRAQLGTASTTLPVITSLQTAVPFASLTTLAPGSNFVLSGTDLAFVATDLSGIPNLQSFPTSLNGISVTAGGVAVPLSSVAAGQIRGQLPFNIGTGQVPLVVTNSNGSSSAFLATIATASPAVLYGPGGAIATRQSDNKTITASNPATPGDVIVVTATGLGLTNPAFSAGTIFNSNQTFSVMGDISASIGGINTTVISANALPGMPGLYQVAILVPHPAPPRSSGKITPSRPS